MKRAFIGLALLVFCGIAAAAYQARMAGEWPALSVFAPHVDVSFDRESIDFGTTVVGVAAVSSVVMTNLGEEAAELLVNGSGPFRPVHGRVQLGPRSASVVAFEFLPETPGGFTGELAVTSGSRKVGVFSLRGVAERPPQISLEPRLLDFGPVSIGEELGARIKISNQGDRELEVTRLGVVAPFYMQGEEFRVAPRSSTLLEIAFAPDQVGPETARLLLQSNDPARPTVAFELTGQGIDGFLSPVIEATPEVVSFGRVAPGKTSRRFIEIRNPSDDPLTIASVLVNAPFRTAARSRTIPPRGFVRLPVTFTPQSEVDEIRGSLSIFSNDPDAAELVVELSGQASAKPSGSGTPGITVIGSSDSGSAAEGESRLSGTDGVEGSAGSRFADADTGGAAGADIADRAGADGREEAAAADSRIEDGSYVNLASFHEDIAAPNVEAIDYNAQAGTLTLRGFQLPTVDASLGEFFQFTSTDIVGHVDETGEVTARVPVQIIDDRGDAVAMEFELTTDTASLVYDGVEVAFVGSPLDPAGFLTLVGAGTVPDGRLKGQFFTMQMNLNVKETSLAE